MKFKELLNEKYVKTVEIVPQGTFEIFESGPNFKKELKELLKNSYNNSIRLGVTDTKKPKIWAWDSEMLHHKAKTSGKLKFDVGFVYEKSNGDLSTFAYDADEWDDNIKYKKEIITELYKYLHPMIKTIRTADGYHIGIYGKIMD